MWNKASRCCQICCDGDAVVQSITLLDIVVMHCRRISLQRCIWSHSSCLLSLIVVMSVVKTHLSSLVKSNTLLAHIVVMQSKRISLQRCRWSHSCLFRLTVVIPVVKTHLSTLVHSNTSLAEIVVMHNLGAYLCSGADYLTAVYCSIHFVCFIAPVLDVVI